MSLTYINKPNFFILGAGKSGTTSLYYHLKEHPEIFLTDVKEPTFFNEGFQVINNPIKYFELFDSVSSEKIVGEASHTYLSNPTTAKVLKALFPETRFVVILRNPADRAYSLYHHMRRLGFEYASTFESALEKEESRFTSKHFISDCPQYFYNFLYYRSGLYGEQLQRYLSVFPKQQFHIIKFDEFIENPDGHFNDIFEFLDVSLDFTPQFEVRNAGKKTARCPKLQYFVKTKVTTPRIARKILMSVLKRVNMAAIPPMREETRAMLLERYAPDLQLLDEMTGISFRNK